MFFDRAEVIRRIDKGTRRVLSRFGAFVRRTARQSIRKRKRASKPGQPPSSHTGLLKQFIFFGYDARQRSVVIGPEKLKGPVSEKAPSALEYGGESLTWDKKFGPIGGHVRSTKTHRKIKVAARPFMRPAFAKEKPGLPGLWRDSII